MLSEEILLKQPQGLLMPLQGLWTAAVVFLMLQIVLNSLFNRPLRVFLVRSLAVGRSVRYLCLPAAGHGGTLALRR